MPHATQSFVDVLHDLRGRIGPAQLKELLPNMACIAMNHSLGDPPQELVDHDRLVLFWHGIECLLHDVAAERVHGEIESMASNRLRNLDDLLRRAMLETALNKEVPETVDHQRIGLRDDGFNNVILLLRGPNLELLLEEDGRLLIIVADDLVHDVLPIAVDIAVKEAAVVERLSRGQICLTLSGDRLF